jgi:hypothetical protein
MKLPAKAHPNIIGINTKDKSKNKTEHINPDHHPTHWLHSIASPKNSDVFFFQSSLMGSAIVLSAITLVSPIVARAKNINMLIVIVIFPTDQVNLFNSTGFSNAGHKDHIPSLFFPC